ncbi:MAG: hypothetical protein LQ341_001846 [Variospora aurantia]|nr:MAG: hypothetical protein LQ341_001846 [Variospora aurantia]
MAAAEAPEKKWYFGNCHCAAVKFKVHMPPLDEHQVKTCNCSICSRNGYMHVYPARADVVYLKGEDSVKGYYFGGKKAEHKFCPNCGSSISVDPHGAFGEEDMVRMLQDVELDQLKVGTVDGKTFGAPYDPK